MSSHRRAARRYACIAYRGAVRKATISGVPGGLQAPHMVARLNGSGLEESGADSADAPS